MNAHNLVDTLGYLEPIACLVALILMQSRRQVEQYRALALFLAVRVASVATMLALMHVRKTGQLSGTMFYPLYFYCYWGTYLIEGILGFYIIYSIYNLAMAPLKGLQRLGILMFRWAGGIAVAIAITMALGPNVSSAKFIVRAVGQLQQTQSVLTLCMLLFVCLAIRPMGLSYRSKIFGVSLGLGVLATVNLVSAAWLSHYTRMYSAIDVVNGLAICLTLAIWIGYFAMPEPKRRMIVLPTTSPFLRWNQISLALGDAPGFVALGEVSPDMFAPAEVEIMRRASLKMNRSVAN